jgi:hypothetical protein
MLTTILLTILMIIPTTKSFAQDSTDSFFPKEEFQPFMLDHAHEGCPANSHCHESYGKRRKRFSDLLVEIRAQRRANPIQVIEAHRREHGIPFRLWAYPESLKNIALASWNSKCRQHNLETGEIFVGEVLIRDLSELPKEVGHTQPHRTWMLTSTGPQLYLVPQGTLPLLMINDKLYYTREELGVYYGLLVGRDGSLEIVDIKKPSVAPREVHCPQELKNAHNDWPEAKQIFQNTYCRAIWDETRKTYQTFLIGWAC